MPSFYLVEQGFGTVTDLVTKKRGIDWTSWKKETCGFTTLNKTSRSLLGTAKHNHPNDGDKLIHSSSFLLFFQFLIVLIQNVFKVNHFLFFHWSFKFLFLFYKSSAPSSLPYPKLRDFHIEERWKIVCSSRGRQLLKWLRNPGLNLHQRFPSNYAYLRISFKQRVVQIITNDYLSVGVLYPRLCSMHYNIYF